MTDEIGKETEKEIGKEMKQEMMKSEIQPESGESSKLIGTRAELCEELSPQRETALSIKESAMQMRNVSSTLKR